MTLGPTELIINEFVLTQKPDAAVLPSIWSRVHCVVGGFISKFSNPQGFNAARVQTATATIGIRGGISMIDHDGQDTSAVFLFGQQLQIAGLGGQTLSITRPGFGSTIGSNGSPSAPYRTSPDQLAKPA